MKASTRFFVCFFVFLRENFIRKWGSKTPKTLKIVSATFLLVCFLGLSESIFPTKRNVLLLQLLFWFSRKSSFRILHFQVSRRYQCISITVCQLGGVNPTSERYILGPTPLNRHMSLVPKKWCCPFFIFLLCVYFAEQNPCGLEFSGNT